MYKTFLPAALLAGLVATAARVPAVADARPSLQSACAVWDLHIVALIEEVGLVEPASMRLVEAAQTLARARVACSQSDAEKAMRFYEAIDLRPSARGTLPVFGLF